MSPFPIEIRPDVVLSSGGVVVGIVDAKYKRVDDKGYENHDFYQMLAYGTALKSSRTYLFFPSTEVPSEKVVHIHNSPITIDIRCIDLTSPSASALLEGQIGALVTDLDRSIL
jgi:5-methylcytosine-specific restriction endonuclease McrBC regulatory subunit McrC